MGMEDWVELEAWEVQVQVDIQLLPKLQNMVRQVYNFLH